MAEDTTVREPEEPAQEVVDLPDVPVVPELTDDELAAAPVRPDDQHGGNDDPDLDQEVEPE